MSLLNENFAVEIDDHIALETLLDTFNPRRRNNMYLGMTHCDPIRNNISQIFTHKPEPRQVSLENGRLDFYELCAHIHGPIDFNVYGIHTISAHKGLRIAHADSKKLPHIMSAPDLVWEGTIDGLCNKRMSGQNILLRTYFISNSGVQDCVFHCDKLILGDLPHIFKNNRGQVREFRARVMDFDELEKFYGNYAIPQVVGGKRIRHLRDIRAFFNNRKKYGEHWGDPNELIDAPSLISSMGLDKMVTDEITIRDCNFMMVFKKGQNWRLAYAGKT